MVVKTLLDEGADVNQKNEYVVVLLAEGGAVCHTCCCRDGEAPIHKAAEYNNLSCLEFLVALKAAEGCHLSCLEFLVARGADVHAQNE